MRLDYILELFLNKRERNSTVQHRRQSHRPQSSLCDCGSHEPKCCSASCRQSPARQRCGPDSRRSWQPLAPRSGAAGDVFCSCAASALASQSDRHDSLLASRENLHRPEPCSLYTRPAPAAVLVCTCCPQDDAPATYVRARQSTCQGEP
jgi:hypothetical protein